MNNPNLAYVAGVMDGDGSFSIDKIKTKANPLYTPLISCNTSRVELVNVLHGMFGGHVYSHRYHIKNDGESGRLMYRWTLMSKDNVKPALLQLIPYLQTKRERAEHLLRFIDSFDFQRGKKQTIEQLTSKEKFYLKMIGFNDPIGLCTRITLKKAVVPNDVSEVWSYIAGCMDTDGYFQIKKQVQNKGTQVKNSRYTGLMSFSSTDARAINFWLSNVPFGKLNVIKNKSTSLGFYYNITLSKHQECVTLLEKIMPYLTAKKTSALILQEFFLKKSNTKNCRLGVSHEELQFRDQCYNKICYANKNVGSLNLL